jgi:hypothetical protein
MRADFYARLILQLCALLGVVSLTSPTSVAGEPVLLTVEDYAVYSAALNTRFGDFKARSTLLIDTTTTSFPP